jgi:hypothetical protein
MCFFDFMARWGIWEMLSLIIVLVPSVLVWIYLFPRKAVHNLYIDTRIASDPEDHAYPKKIVVELRNHTNEPIYVLSEGFLFGDTILPSPHGAKDAATGAYEVKFEGREKNFLSEIDTLVRPNQVVETWVPVDPNQSDEALSTALSARTVGILRLKCQKIRRRPHPFTKLRIPV